MYLPGVRQHIKVALDHGATGAEIMEVLELTATLGIHAMNVGMPVLAEVLSELGRRPAPELDAGSGRSRRSSPGCGDTGTRAGTTPCSSLPNCWPRTWSSPACRGAPAASSPR